MRIFDPHVHMYSRITDDYEKMALAGVEVIVEPSFWLGNPRKHLGTFVDYFDHILEFETQRAAQFGIRHYATLSMNPKEANDRGLTREVLALLDSYLDRPGVVAVGEIGFDLQTEAEEEAIRAQLEMARKKNLPVVIHLPHQHKLKGTLRNIEICKDVGSDPRMILLDHNTEETIPYSRDYGGWCGHTVYPVTKLSPERAANIIAQYGVERMLVNSAADWGPSDPLSVPKTIVELKRRDYPEDRIQQLVWNNPLEFFRQSGRMADLPASNRT